MEAQLDHRSLYRLPWNLSDNVISWLEPTAKCNLTCEGCYRENVDQHKTLEQVDADLDVFAKYRTFDGVSIAGGDPLLHPQIVEIVRRITARGWKAIINTNGQALGEKKLRELKDAGLVGFTFHIDSHQGRKNWTGKTEQEMCELREKYANMVASVGGLSCAFNATIYEDTLDSVPDLVAWAQKNIDKVAVMVFILYRSASEGAGFDYFKGGERVNTDPLVYVDPTKKQRTDISAREVVAKIQERYPDFAPCAYLNGTEKPDSFKWLQAARLGTPDKIYGYVGPKAMEAVQAGHHLLTGRYLAYAPERMMKMSKAMLGLSAIDPKLRTIAKNMLREPSSFAKPLYFQSVLIIQPIDLLIDGRMNMCDGCPDMTVYDGRLAWSCRLEECTKYGQFLSATPKH